MNRMRHNRMQKGFINVMLISSILGGMVALTLASKFVANFSQISQIQSRLQTKARMEEMANVLAQSAGDNGGVVYSAPPMSATSGGIPLDSLADSDTCYRLPSGYADRFSSGNVCYIAFAHMFNPAPDSPGVMAPPNGYFAGNLNSIPNGSDVSFALLYTGENGIADTSISDIKNKVARGDDTVVLRSIEQVAGASLKKLIENAGSIPTCGMQTDTTNNTKFHSRLNWSLKDKQWQCVPSEIKSFALNDPDKPLVCATGSALSTVRKSDGTYDLTCSPTTVQRINTGYGSFIDADGTSHNLMHDKLATEVPCSGDSSKLKWNPSGGTSSALVCDGSAGFAAVTDCPEGHFVARSLNRYSMCFDFNEENLNKNGGSGWRSRCSNNVTPFYADQKTYCPEDAVQGGKPLCKAGFQVAYVGDKGGLGCYLMNDPNSAAGQAEYRAVQLNTSCPANTVLQVTADDRTLAKCVGIFEAISFAMPATACPNVGPKRGALTFNKTTNKFTCTTVD